MSDASRKIAVIVALDVAGYSARTEADEAKTTTEVAALRRVIEAIANAHAGRVFNTAGDGFMLEFGSSVAAIEAASELADKCEPRVRIGVHLGEVVVQPNGDLLGHGVNVAARLMTQSIPGSALVSADVRRTIRGPSAERLVSQGMMQLDKMAETIEAFALVTPAYAAQSAKEAPARTEKATEATLAVLPFDNLSDDKEMQFFSDGVSEEILQALTRSAGMRVIGRTSSFQFRGERKGEAGHILKATHILDGTVRKAGARLRINVQLTETATNAALWSERYDRDLTDVLALQDDIAATVASSLRGVLRSAPRTPQIDPRAYELYLKAYQQRSLISPEGFGGAQLLLEEVVAREPDFVDAWALLGTVRTMLLSADRDSTGTPQHNAALAATRRALALDPNCAIAYWNLTNLMPAFGQYAERLQLARRGVELAPNGSSLVRSYSSTLYTVGRRKEGMPYSLRAATLDPMNPMNASAVAGDLENDGRPDEALAYLDTVFKVQPPSLWTAVVKFMIFFNASRFAEAAAYLNDSILGQNEELKQIFGFLLTLPTLPQQQTRTVFVEFLKPRQDRALALGICGHAVRFGCADIVFDRLFAELDAGRPIAGSNVNSVHASRATVLSLVFGRAEAKPFIADARFPGFCARIGLIDYWRASGRWPDCADEVPYDFKSECERAAAEVSKT